MCSTRPIDLVNITREPLEHEDSLFSIGASSLESQTTSHKRRPAATAMDPASLLSVPFGHIVQDPQSASLRQDPPWFEFLVIFDFFAPWYSRDWEASSVKIL